MKTNAIELDIIKNYRQLNQLAHVNPEKEDILPSWGIVYNKDGKSGFVNERGVIEIGRSTIHVSKDGIQLEKKPFYMAKQRVLVKINRMLQDVIANIDNEAVVTKKIVNILCFPADFAAKLSRIMKY